MYLTANSLLKIFVRDLAVPVSIEFIKDRPKLLVSDAAQTPVLEVEPELLWLNAARFLDIHVHEGLAQCFPLELDLFNDNFI